MSAVATMPTSSTLRADHDVHASSCGIGNKKEAGSRTKDEDSDDMSRFQSLLDDWTSKQRAAHPTTGTGGATITQEMILKTLQNISDKWQKHATILPKGERILHHFSWQPTDDLHKLSYGRGWTKESLANFLSVPTNKTITMVRHAETNDNNYTLAERSLKKRLGRNINYTKDRPSLPEVTIMNKDRTTSRRKLRNKRERRKLRSYAAITAEGFAQAEATGTLIRSGIPEIEGSKDGPITHWFISELPRTLETLFAMYGHKPDLHVVGAKSGTIPCTSVTYSSLAALNEHTHRHGGDPTIHREVLEAILRESDERSINRIGVIGHGGMLAGLTDNILNTAPTDEYYFSNCQADTTLFSSSPPSKKHKSLNTIMDSFLKVKAMRSESALTINETGPKSEFASHHDQTGDTESVIEPVSSPTVGDSLRQPQISRQDP